MHFFPQHTHPKWPWRAYRSRFRGVRWPNHRKYAAKKSATGTLTFFEAGQRHAQETSEGHGVNLIPVNTVDRRVAH